MNKKYLKIVNLSVSENLAKFINKELLPGTKIKKEKFGKVLINMHMNLRLRIKS